MDLRELIHIKQGETLSFKPDVFIAASGYESRSTYVPSKFKEIKCRKIVLAFKDYKDEHSRSDNDSYFEKNAFEFYNYAGEESPDYKTILDQHENESLKILVDISVMTRYWYYCLLRYVHSMKPNTEVILRIIYTPAVYAETPVFKGKLSMKKMEIVNDHRKTAEYNSKEKVLIMGLGNEKGLAKMIYDSINPEEAFLFYPDPSVEKAYIDNLFLNNHQIIEQISIKKLLAYPLNNTEILYKKLLNILLPLRQQYRIILIPQGPKIFALMCMVLQISYPDIDLYFPGRKPKRVKDRIAASSISAIELHYESE